MNPTDDSTTPIAIGVPLSNENEIEIAIGIPIADDLPISKSLDLVFVMDCTGSMGSYIDSAKQSIQDIVRKIILHEKNNVRFGLIAYRDHPPQDSTYVTKIFDFTDSLDTMQINLNGLSAQGGGDGPEALTAGLHAAYNLPWREKAAKIVIVITDAPPHGIGESGDGFPNGDPDGHDPLQIARNMAQREIVIYAVGCEPALSNYVNARAFMVALAEITQGQAINLANSSLLGQVILGGSLEEIGLQTLSAQYESEMATLAQAYVTSGRDLSEASTVEDMANELQSRMRVAGVQATCMKTDGKMADTRSPCFSTPVSLEAARELLKKNPAPPPPQSRFLGRSGPPSSCPPGAPPAPSLSGGITKMFSGSIRKKESKTHARVVDGEKEVDVCLDEMEICDNEEAVSTPSSFASSCTVEREDISYERVSRMVKRAQLQGKLG